ncbi:MAG: PIN domain-containing protein [Candidatus Methanomethyliaceae archaeon]
MGLRALLTRHRRLAADTMVFIYYLGDHPRYAALLQPLFQAWEEGRAEGVTSVLTLLEILVKPLREGRPEVARDYRDLLTTYPELALVPVDTGRS